LAALQSLDFGKFAAVPDWHLPVLLAGEDGERRAMWNCASAASMSGRRDACASHSACPTEPVELTGGEPCSAPPIKDAKSAVVVLAGAPQGRGEMLGRARGACCTGPMLVMEAPGGETFDVLA
jgi:hypothetical protein